MSKNINKSDFKSLSVTETDIRYFITTNTIGFQSVEPNESYPVKNYPENCNFKVNQGRILNEYQFIYIVKGSGILISESEKIAVLQGNFIIISPGVWHTYYPDDAIGWSEYYIGFQGDIVQGLFTNSFFTKSIQLLDIGLNDELLSLFKRAVEIARKSNNGSQQYLAGIVMHMIGLVLFESNNNCFHSSKVLQQVENAKIVMNEHVFQHISPEEVAQKLNVSYTGFQKNFKKITGYSPAKYFKELKIQKAKQLLFDTTDSVKEISYALNYSSVEHFILNFKARTGLSPTDYRKFIR